MALFPQFDPSKRPRGKIELHVHLDGAVRLTTIWELAQKKRIPLPARTLDELTEKCNVHQPSTLAAFLDPFKIISPILFRDLEAIERVAFETCEDSYNQGVIYTEIRYSPHLLCMDISTADREGPQSGVTPKSVVEAVNMGFERAQEKYDIKVRSILCCFRGKPEWSSEVVNLCQEFKNKGVVAIDVVGDEAHIMAATEDIAAFQRAAQLGIHRTAHAAEAGPASNILLALDDMKAERIGHGYHVLEDDKIYQRCLALDVHFEVCPYSSFLTGSVPASTMKHPAIRFAEDNANFSFSRDDPFIIQKTLDEEYELMKSLGMSYVHMTRANFHAARSCFLPEKEKEELLTRLKTIYCIDV